MTSFLQSNDVRISHKSRWGHYTNKLHRVISDTIFGSTDNSCAPLDKGNYNIIDGGDYETNYGSISPYQSSSNNDDNIGSPSLQPVGGPSTGSSRRKIGLLTLVVLIYYEVCGGPFGERL